ncbi:MAG: CDP-alcohol phosphatidyltransferase family protein [Immundisolibacter sp.]|uniref:CDP-alcohol phosphatidyltransferase family protein n=1 Tax=Immundisolibacter sp. TaxID=1934948 RepID=UPI003EE00939
MKSVAYLAGDGPVRLWGLSGRERLCRVLAKLGIDVLDEHAPAAPGQNVLCLRADYLYDERVVAALAEAPGVALRGADGQLVAVHAPADAAPRARAVLAGSQPPDDFVIQTPGDLASSYQERLRKSSVPYVLPITAQDRTALERRLFGTAYKGVTDFITKWWWPAPARLATGFCADRGITPNQVTLGSLVLTVAAGLAFWYGWLAVGLVCGWAMTFLDTVDGKLARVTVNSSRFGDILDHGIDLIHPPFWYAAWALGLPAAEVPVQPLIWVIVAGYVAGRLAEGLFQLVCAKFSLFVWRLFDSYNRLITARRNPNLLLLTACLLVGKPGLGLWLVAGWTVLSTLVLWGRVGLAIVERRRGPLQSWLTQVGREVPASSLAARWFAS